MAELVVHLSAPMDHQIPVITSPAREKVVACGRRWGKTMAAIFCALNGHGGDSSWHRGVLAGANVWWVSPTYPMSTLVWRKVKDILRDVWVDKSEVERRVVLPGGGMFSVKSADQPDLLRGEGLDGVVQDEAAFQDEEVYKSVIRPALMDRKGWWLGISTPNGLNWFHEKFERTPPDARWQRPSWDNPILDEDERRKIWEEYSGVLGVDARRIAELDLRYRQEIMAEFVSETSGAFDPNWWRDYEAYPQKTPRRVLQCWDTAFGKNEGGDYSVCVTVSEFDDGLYVRDVWRGRPSFPDLKKMAVRLYDTFHPDLVLIEDKASGQSLIQELKRETTIPLHPIRVDKDKPTRVNSATPLVQGGRVFLPKFASWRAEFVRELSQFPNGAHDDQVDAFAHLVNYVRFRVGEPERERHRSPLIGGPCYPDREEVEEKPSTSDMLGDIFAVEEFANL